MTDPEPLEGTHDNGERADLVVEFFTGPAGMRTLGGGVVEIAYFGEETKAKLGAARFGDKAIVITGKRAGSVRGMTVLTATLVEDDQALRQ